MEPATIMTLISGAISLANGLISKSPDYSEAEKKRFNRRVGEFKEEVDKPLHERDHELIMNLAAGLQIEMGLLERKL